MVLRKTKETDWKLWFGKGVCVNGPAENRVKPILKCCVCIRSLRNQRRSIRSTQFLSTVLRKTEETYWIVMLWGVVFVDCPEETKVKPILKCCFCTRSLAKQRSSRISVVRCWLFWFMVLGETTFQHKKNKHQVNFWRYRSPCGIVRSRFFTMV